MTNSNKNLTITEAANGYRIDDGDETTKFIKAGNACLAADIVSDAFGKNAALYDALISYLDAGCELIDIEDEDGDIVINALRNGCDVGEYVLTPGADSDDVNLVELFNALPNLYN